MIANDPRVAALIDQLRSSGHEGRHLDQAVHNAAEERATDVNNDGIEAQVKFLLHGSDLSWDPSEILGAAASSKEEEEG
jgi:hypothetical protein